MITYNHEIFIREAIEGVLMQKASFDYQLVIGEDYSTDSTWQICEEYAKRYPEKIKLLLRPEKNLGMMPNFIRTLEACKAKYIALCEGDDYWTDPLKLQKQVGFLEKNEKYSICFHDVDVLYPNGTIHSHAASMGLSKVKYIKKDLLERWFIPTCSIVYRNLMDKMPDWFSEVESGDLALCILLSDYGNAYLLKEKMGVYRKHDGGVSTHHSGIIFLKSHLSILNNYALQNPDSDNLLIKKAKLYSFKIFFDRLQSVNSEYMIGIELLANFFPIKTSVLRFYSKILPFGIIKKLSWRLLK